MASPSEADDYLVRVVLPPGVSDGDEFFVTGADGIEYAVYAPAGCQGGDEIDVALPRCSSPVTLMVTIPELCGAGDEFTVMHDGGTFSVIVPDAMAGGDELHVEVPPDALHPAAAPAGPPEQHESPVGRRPGQQPSEDGSWGMWTWNAPLSKGASPFCSPHATRPPVSPHATRPPAAAPPHSPAPPMAPPRAPRPAPVATPAPPVMTPLPPPPPRLERFSTFCVGLAVEVLRSNNSWTRGTIQTADDGGCTFTVLMEDGRLKYMVEQDDLRHYRVGAYATGDVVCLKKDTSLASSSGSSSTGATGGGPQETAATHATDDGKAGGGLGPRARVCDYDEESDTYTLILADGRKQYFVESDEIALTPASGRGL